MSKAVDKSWLALALVLNVLKASGTFCTVRQDNVSSRLVSYSTYKKVRIARQVIPFFQSCRIAERPSKW